MDGCCWKYFPAASIGILGGLAEFAGQAFERMCEQPIYPTRPSQSLVIRLLCLPTWQSACSVRVVTDKISWSISGRELDGKEAGFELGELAHREDRQLSIEQVAQIDQLWDYLKFWSLEPESGDEVLDGADYVLEAAERGRYHLIHRCDPEWGDTFGDFACLLFQLAGLASR